MKKISQLPILFASLALLFSSCEKQPECNDPVVKSMVLDILKEDLDKQEIIFNQLGIYNFQEYSDNFFASMVEVKSVRTTDKNEDLKSCECEAEIEMLSQEGLEPYKQRLFESVPEFMEILTSDVPLNYSIQMTEDDELYVETEIPTDDLYSNFLGYFYLSLNEAEANSDFEDFIDTSIETSEEYRFKMITEKTVEEERHTILSVRFTEGSDGYYIEGRMNKFRDDIELAEHKFTAKLEGNEFKFQERNKFYGRVFHFEGSVSAQQVVMQEIFMGSEQRYIRIDSNDQNLAKAFKI